MGCDSMASGYLTCRQAADVCMCVQVLLQSLTAPSPTGPGSLPSKTPVAAPPRQLHVPPPRSQSGDAIFSSSLAPTSATSLPQPEASSYQKIPPLKISSGVIPPVLRKPPTPPPPKPSKAPPKTPDRPAEAPLAPLQATEPAMQQQSSTHQAQVWALQHAQARPPPGFAQPTWTSGPQMGQHQSSGPPLDPAFPSLQHGWSNTSGIQPSQQQQGFATSAAFPLAGSYDDPPLFSGHSLISPPSLPQHAASGPATPSQNDAASMGSPSRFLPSDLLNSTGSKGQRPAPDHSPASPPQSFSHMWQNHLAQNTAWAGNPAQGSQPFKASSAWHAAPADLRRRSSESAAGADIDSQTSGHAGSIGVPFTSSAFSSAFGEGSGSGALQQASGSGHAQGLFTQSPLLPGAPSDEDFDKGIAESVIGHVLGTPDESQSLGGSRSRPTSSQGETSRVWGHRPSSQPGEHRGRVIVFRASCWTRLGSMTNAWCDEAGWNSSCLFSQQCVSALHVILTVLSCYK